jgi:uracil-DNA glycosylase
MNIQDELLKWANETVDVYKHQQTDSGFYTQTPLCNISKLPDLLILGINPGYGGGKDNMTGEELLKGNPCFNGLDDKGIIYVMSEKPDENKKRKGWALWHRLNSMLEYSYNKKNKDLLRDLNRFVLSNMIFYGTEKESQIPKIEREECAKQTMKLITILQPKVVLLLGNQSRKLYDRISSNKLEMLVPNSMYHCMFEKSHVLAIKHTAYYYSSIEMELIGKTIGYLLDHQEETINSETIRASSIKEEIIRFEQKQRTINLQGNESLYYLKQKISAKGCNIMIDHNGHLIYEYYCNNAHNKYIKANGTISIEISYDNKQCSFSLMTKGNHPEDLLKKVQETCDELKVFKMDSKDCFVADVGTDDGKIVEFFNDLLAIIKEYREIDLPE